MVRVGEIFSSLTVQIERETAATSRRLLTHCISEDSIICQTFVTFRRVVCIPFDLYWFGSAPYFIRRVVCIPFDLRHFERLAEIASRRALLRDRATALECGRKQPRQTPTGPQTGPLGTTGRQTGGSSWARLGMINGPDGPGWVRLGPAEQPSVLQLDCLRLRPLVPRERSSGCNFGEPFKVDRKVYQQLFE